MAVKYKATFPDIFGKLYHVEILDDSYSGPSKVMELGGEGVVISRSGKKITEPIFSMGATIQVWSNTDFEYTPLFSTPEQTNQMVIGCGDQVIFRGWIEPSLYEEDYMSPPYLITIPAGDGLAALGNYYPRGFSEARPITLISIIRECLKCTGMNLPVNVACGLNFGNHTDNRIFEKAFVEIESLRTYEDGVYKFDDALKLLEDVLKPFSCRIYQSNDEWYIERIKDRTKASVTWVKYTSDTDFTTVTTNSTVMLDSPEFRFVDNAATLQIDAGYGTQTIKADGDTWDSVILNNFDYEILNVETDLYPFNVPHKIWFSTGNGITTTPFTDKWGMKQGVEIQHNRIMSRKVAVWQTAKLTAKYGDKINISFKCTIKPGSKPATDGIYKICIQSQIKDSVYNDLLTLKWVKGKNDETYYLSDNILGTDYTSTAEFSKKDDWKKGFSEPIDVSITVEIDAILLFSQLDEISFAILPALAKNGAQWMQQPEYVEATIIGDIEVKVNEKQKCDNTFTAAINRQQLRKAEDIDIRFWTLPSTALLIGTASNYNYKNGLIDYEYKAIPNITCPAEDEYATSLPERLLIDNFDQYYDPRDLISGSVMTTDLLSPDLHYTVASLKDKTFLLTGLEANLRDASYEINVEEIKSHQITANIK